MVVANAVAALSEIHEYSKSECAEIRACTPGLLMLFACVHVCSGYLAHACMHAAGSVFELTAGTVSKLLTALNECTEWGQVSLPC